MDFFFASGANKPKKSHYNCSVRVYFVQKSEVNASNKNVKVIVLDYCETTQRIMKIGFRRFELFIFSVKWFEIVIVGWAKCTYTKG